MSYDIDRKGGPMSRIAIIIADLFEDSEYTEPVKAFRENSHQVSNIGLETGRTVTGKKKNTPVVIDQDFESISVEDFDAMLIPGGYSPDKLRAHDNAVHFTKAFVESGKPVFSICHGPQILITADVLKGRTLTGYKSIVQDIKNAGATFIDQEVVVDDNLVTSRTPADLPAFIRASLDKLG